MNHTLRQHRALAAYRAQLNKQEEQRRLARLDAIRHRLLRRFITDRNGWLFAAAALGAAFAVVLTRLAS